MLSNCALSYLAIWLTAEYKDKNSIKLLAPSKTFKGSSRKDKLIGDAGDDELYGYGG